jgi:hypothetical protein
MSVLFVYLFLSISIVKVKKEFLKNSNLFIEKRWQIIGFDRMALVRRLIIFNVFFSSQAAVTM